MCLESPYMAMIHAEHSGQLMLIYLHYAANSYSLFRAFSYGVMYDDVGWLRVTSSINWFEVSLEVSWKVTLTCNCDKELAKFH